MAVAEKVSIELPSDMLRTIRQSVEAGEFGSESEALQDAVRAWQRERHAEAEQLEAIRAKIDRSINDPRPSLTSEEARAAITRFIREEEEAALDETR
ncbi:ribbon-helix-helix domain-containing protein [Jiella marina]|uniref:ribbon-helix-helix domain-containing protein n=1 Tax=Jiella sp. LLJ827 TaxID=2917712 RepID=UPI00210151DD|nr:type II toxin-antitoxin system ParD family antitoxin [Jiella sp. LLJ827]MCQ0989458.1 type II toxin-antitoxin system ParD family antitoxin [Jiella sp. LLJ827]